jgi:hypothetical protein
MIIVMTFPFKVLIGVYPVSVFGIVNWSLSTKDHILCVCVCVCARVCVRACAARAIC